MVKFTRNNNFNLWKCEVQDALLQLNQQDALEENKPVDMTDADWTLLKKKACGSIRSCLSQSIKYKMMNETLGYQMWTKLEAKYSKTTIHNKLVFLTV